MISFLDDVLFNFLVSKFYIILKKLVKLIFVLLGVRIKKLVEIVL